MKKILLSTFIVLSNLACAQGNLQFNQVKLVTSLETVPLGKVWKIESVIYNIALSEPGYQASSGSCNSTSNESTGIVIAGVPTKVGQGTQAASYSSLTYTHSYTILPLWIPAGTTLSGGTCLNKISVIEFNIIP
jgi:hypothetical protein